MTYDHAEIARLRDEGLSWEEVADHLATYNAAFVDTNPKKLRDAHNKWLKRNEHVPESERTSGRDFLIPETWGDTSVSVPVPPEWNTVPRTIDQLREMVEASETDWEVKHFSPNFWEGPVAGGGSQVYHQMKADLIPNRDRKFAAAKQAIETALEAFKEHDPYWLTRSIASPQHPLKENAGPLAGFVNICDPHLGMLAHGIEVSGEDWDLARASADYRKAADHLTNLMRIYPLTEINLVIGNDLVHIDMISQKVGTTAAGTPQDFDSRLHKIFSTAREVSVFQIDLALSLGVPVNVWVVPGNHDAETMYKLGEVLFAWYRSVPEVTVHYGPNKRRWHGFGRNAILMTHGEESQRQRRNLPLIALTEMPDRLRATLPTHVEILTGHLHTKKTGEYVPSSLIDEERKVTVRSMRGLTPPDAWHYLQGYSHQRGAEALVFDARGGVVHEHTYFPR